MNLIKQLIGRLGFRIALVLAVALLPLTIVSVIRSQSVISVSEARSHAALRGETLRAVSPALSQIEVAKGAAMAIASLAAAQSPEGCNVALRELVERHKFLFAGIYDLTGKVSCSSAIDDIAFAVDDAFEELVADPRVVVRINRDAPVSQSTVTFATAPVFDGDVLIGFASVSAPHAGLHGLETALEGLVFTTWNADGRMLTSSNGFDIAVDALPVLPADQGLLDMGEIFVAETEAGQKRSYAVVPVIDGQLYAMGSVPTSGAIGAGGAGFYLTNPAIFPALMWLASLLVAWFACEILVTRHVRRLRSSMVKFARSRTPEPLENFHYAPLELLQAAKAYGFMTETIMREEAELEDTVRQKDILLREVHHRVKNNLQLIASIMNLQMRQSRSPEVQTLMRGLHDRVMSLSTVHRGLYQTSGLAEVRADELLQDIVKQVLRIGAATEHSIDLESEMDVVRLAPDQAVPLALLATEALTNALKYIGSEESDRKRLVIKLVKTAEDKARLSIANTIEGDASGESALGASGFGSQLLDAFTMQLSGTLDKELADNWFTLAVDFEIDEIAS